MQFSFVQAEARVPHYVFDVYANGAGVYREPDAHVSRGVRLGEASVKAIFAAKGAVEYGQCETQRKNIAVSGAKRMVYVGEAGKSACSYNYPEDESVRTATAVFQGVVETIQAGERLEHEQRFDRLSLDAEMESLEDEVKSGQALELGNIAGVLKAIGEDERVMERVRRKALRLVELGR
jgi:hypothetical protein